MKSDKFQIVEFVYSGKFDYAVDKKIGSITFGFGSGAVELGSDRVATRV